jgi:hypothetical protein
MGAPAFAATRFVRSALRSIVVCLSIIVISMMTMAKPAHASGTLSTPPSLLYSVSVWAYCIPGTIVSYPNPSCTMQNVAISCSASSWAGLAPCVTAAAGGPVAINNYFGNYVGGNPFGSTNPVTSHIGCPDHAQVTGNTCTCDDPYVPDTTKTNCVIETLTITLSGGSTTEPWNEKHDPNHMKANLSFLAVVKNQNGQLKAGVDVSTSSDVTPQSGGHNHDGDRPKGKLVATQGNPGGAVSTVNGGNTLSGVTDSSGIFWFTFGAEQASGEHKITATCTGCIASAQNTVKAEIQGVMKLGDDKTCTMTYCLQGGVTHTDNHYFTGAAMTQIVKLAADYKKKYGELLKINDSSLIKGGLYDFKNTWNPPHNGHRTGMVVDINNFSAEDARFEQFVANHQAIADWEDNPPHYHLELLERDE